MTLRGRDCLTTADVVFYDYLVNPAILEHVRPGIPCHCLGKHGKGKLVPQEDINRQMLQAARLGQRVVRLKGGDPAIFGRLGEEIEFLEREGIPYEIVPGITAALACGSYVGISLTHRDEVSAVALVTGQERDQKQSPAIDYAQLAGFPGALVFYMGVTSARTWSKSLIDGGKPRNTPVAIVRRCSWFDQSVHRCTLDDVAESVAREKIRPPVLFIVGEVARHVNERTRLRSRPLSGTRIVVTRPDEQSSSLRELLSDLGADVLVQPAIKILDPPDWRVVDETIEKLDTFDWIVFSSANGVSRFLGRILATGKDVRLLRQTQIAVIGPGTAEALLTFGLRADVMPNEYRAEALADLLSRQAAGKRFLLIRASRGRELLAEQLGQAQGIVEQVVAYRSEDVSSLEPHVQDAIESGTVSWVTVTSSAIAVSLTKLLGKRMVDVKLASISPVTTKTLNDLGFPPTVEATEYTTPGLVEAILSAS